MLYSKSSFSLALLPSGYFFRYDNARADQAQIQTAAIADYSTLESGIYDTYGAGGWNEYYPENPTTQDAIATTPFVEGLPVF